MTIPSVPKDWRKSLDAVIQRDIRRQIVFAPGNTPTEGRTLDDSAILDLAAIITEQRDLLENLLARIHGDGGQHTAKVGLEQACKDADAKVVELIARAEKAEAELAEIFIFNREMERQEMDGR